ncbi:MAG: ASCH domain-containing protein [Gammaproteobacteria bacterium]|nr:MAG: ASCH domain-containing protein [Gammaproteobacteria bacterium]
MARNMSFGLTRCAFLEKTKTVTRRLGWAHLKPGTVLCGVEKSMGLRKGQKVTRLGMIRVVNVRAEPLNVITKEDCILEGFPEFLPQDFVRMFCFYNKCKQDQLVNRIEFEYL